MYRSARQRIERSAALVSIMAAALCAFTLEARADTLDVVAPEASLARGEVFAIALRQLPAGVRVRGTWRGASLEFVAGDDGEHLALVGIDLATAPGAYALTILVTRPGARPVRWRRTIEVVDKDYGVQHLRLPWDMVALDKPTLARVRQEARLFSALWPKHTPERYWQGSFVAPVPGERGTPFGIARFLNGQPRSPHSGVDLRAALGELVRATNRGRVALVGDFFFHGVAVVLDHGQGLYSMYFHLSRLDVGRGDLVDRGDVIGLAGSTGRSTGPHLHWGIRLAGARVDPFSLIAASGGSQRPITEPSAGAPVLSPNSSPR